MRKLLLSLLALYFTNTLSMEKILHLFLSSLNGKIIKFDQESINYIPALIRNSSVAPDEESAKKVIHCLIQYGKAHNFNHKTELGFLKYKPNGKEVPSIEKLSEPGKVENYSLKVIFDSKKFKGYEDKKLAIVLGAKGNPTTSMTPAMVELLQEMKQKYSSQ